ncbi:hypothetical protein PAALTS15_23825 [Paenibacillus alvei TS-15]|uniref:Uncharacterized protein n=1 Tax=Paenibacillus alvei TS-15 TaxID=1117108 RepID=S9SJ27_PAEAL|nr:hypothetical protein [Paenibacillus alvei]EPY04704.1 hypothetical protein PAALTS15_23825 [Paenibacillus alvei TS-15]
MKQKLIKLFVPFVVASLLLMPTLTNGYQAKNDIRKNVQSYNNEAVYQSEQFYMFSGGKDADIAW